MNANPLALTGKVALVTGASTGIGAAVAEHLAAHGASIVRNELQYVAGYNAENFGHPVARFGTPLQPEDIARAITFVASQPAHVHLNERVIRPTRQDYS